jgi:hypothetical protein
VLDANENVAEPGARGPVAALVVAAIFLAIAALIPVVSLLEALLVAVILLAEAPVSVGAAEALLALIHSFWARIRLAPASP